MKVLCPHQTLPFPALCRDHLRSWSCSSPPDSCSLPQPGGAGQLLCHNKTAAGSLRDSQDSCQGQAAAGWDSSSEGKAPLSPDKECAGHRQSLSSVDRFHTQWREKKDGLKAAEGMGYLQNELVFREVGVCSWLGVPCILHPRENSQPDSYNPINTISKGPPELFVKGELKTEQRCAHKHELPAALWTLMAKSTKSRRIGFGIFFSPYVSFKMLSSK